MPEANYSSHDVLKHLQAPKIHYQERQQRAAALFNTEHADQSHCMWNVLTQSIARKQPHSVDMEPACRSKPARVECFDSEHCHETTSQCRYGC